MKLKSLLLGSVAALSFGAFASAADLPSAKAVSYACDSFGAGFFSLPGTDTCLKIGGFVRADYLVHENNATAARWDNAKDIALLAPGALVAQQSDTFATRSRAQVDIDARSKTEYGPLRAFARFRTDTRSDSANAGSILSHVVYPYYAFVQFAGLTAGMAQSQFDFLTYNWLDSYTAGYTFSDRQVNLLAYTFTAAGGFYATVSLEDSNFYDLAPTANLTGYTISQSRNEMPDVVAAVGIKQGWGSAQLSGVYGQQNLITSGTMPSSEQGTRYAIRGGLQVNLDQLAKGDVFAITAAYAEGSSRYLGGIDDASFLVKSVVGGSGWDVDGIKGFSVNGGIKHYWAPNLRSTFAANYAQLDWDNLVKTSALGGASATYTDSILLAQASLIYTPVKNLDLGVEMLYGKREGFTKTSATTSQNRDADTFGAIFRVQRSF